MKTLYELLLYLKGQMERAMYLVTRSEWWLERYYWTNVALCDTLLTDPRVGEDRRSELKTLREYLKDLGG